MITTKNNETMPWGGNKPRVRVFKIMLFLSLMLIASPSVLGRDTDRGRDTGEPCRDQCLLDLYQEMFKRAAKTNDRISRHDERDLRRDIKENNAFTETTKRILRDQVKHKFFQFNTPNDTDAVDIGPVPPEVPLVLIEVSVPGSLGGQEVQDCTLVLPPCVFPNDYDIQEPYVNLMFKLKGNSVSVADLVEYVNLNGVLDFRFIKVFLQGQELTQTNVGILNAGNVFALVVPCPGSLGSTCMWLYFGGKTWYPASPPWPVWQVKIEFFQGLPPVKAFESTAVIVPPPSLKSYWTATIGASVISGRCITCHTMDTPEAIVFRHQAGGVGVAASDIVLITSIIDSTKKVQHCLNCHELAFTYLGEGSTFPENIWATPTKALDINWAKLIINNLATWPSVVCQRIITHLPTFEAREAHFHEDARLFWAVAKGEVPVGGVLPTAPPHNYTKFLSRFDKWNANGALCPQ